MALTDTFVRQVKHSGAPAGDKHSDGQGLYLLINAIGKYWRLNYRFAGKQKTLALGVYPAVSLAKARKRRDEAKEFRDQVMLDAVAAAIRQSAETLQDAQVRVQACEILATLSPREQEVARLVALGQPNKLIAATLGISEKTVHIHRQHVMEKAGLSSAAELARLMLRANPAALD